MARRQISQERKAVYYFGMFLAGAGLLTFLSVFVSGAMHFGDFNNFEERGRSQSMRAVIGMGMIFCGMLLAGIGRMGAAGSGVILDPEQARKDVEPWARMTGGVVKDALDEADIRIGKNTGDTDIPFDEQLRRLHKLREDGILSEEEYLAKKTQILERA